MLNPFSFDTQLKIHNEISRHYRYSAIIWQMRNVTFINHSTKFTSIHSIIEEELCWSMPKLDCEIDNDCVIVMLKIYQKITNEITFNLIHFINYQKNPDLGLAQPVVSFNKHFYKTIGIFVISFLYTIEFNRNIFQILYNKNPNNNCVCVLLFVLFWSLGCSASNSKCLLGYF